MYLLYITEIYFERFDFSRERVASALMFISELLFVPRYIESVIESMART